MGQDLFKQQTTHFGSFGLQINAPNSISASTKSAFLLLLKSIFEFELTNFLKSIIASFLFKFLANTLFTFPSTAILG